MGLSYIEAEISGDNGNKGTSERVKFLIDSGASYTVIPKETWQNLGLKPKRSMNFTLADGTSIDRDISECYIKILDQEGHTPVILGEDNDEPLLGVVTLEIFGLILNPFERTLQPMQMKLA